jgi:hypothetical protein
MAYPQNHDFHTQKLGQESEDTRLTLQNMLKEVSALRGLGDSGEGAAAADALLDALVLLLLVDFDVADDAAALVDLLDALELAELDALVFLPPLVEGFLSLMTSMAWRHCTMFVSRTKLCMIGTLLW